MEYFSLLCTLTKIVHFVATFYHAHLKAPILPKMGYVRCILCVNSTMHFQSVCFNKVNFCLRSISSRSVMVPLMVFINTIRLTSYDFGNEM